MTAVICVTDMGCWYAGSGQHLLVEPPQLHQGLSQMVSKSRVCGRFVLSHVEAIEHWWLDAGREMHAKGLSLMLMLMLTSGDR